MNMDWKEFAESFDLMTCVLSVEKKPDGYGTIRIVTGNQKYLDSLALAGGGVDLDSDRKTEFVPNSEYTRYIPRDLNFEDDIYRCAVLKQPKHKCMSMERYSFDIDIFLMPAAYEEENLAYCTYSQRLIKKEDLNLASLDISRASAADVIRTCVKLRSDKPFDVIMQEVIEDIRQLCGAEFCCVLYMDDNKRTCSVLGEAKASGSRLLSMREYLDNSFYDLAETWLDAFRGSFCLTIQNPNDLEYIRERNPQWYQSLVDARIQSLVIFPLTSQGHFLGYIWAVNFDASSTQHIKDTLQLTTYFIASEIASNRFIEQLRVVSKIDVLTGTMNRNAMNDRIASISRDDPDAYFNMGIVFADMNGLKYVNDHQGHGAGDLLLKNAAIILQSIFVGEEIYRAGGDEFMILLKQTDRDDLEAKIAGMKKRSEMFDNVSFSAGYALLKDFPDIHSALSEADVRMYEDKEAYYQSGGIRRISR